MKQELLLCSESKFYLPGSVKAGAVSGVARCADLFYFGKDCIVVAVDQKLFYILHMAGAQSLVQSSLRLLLQ